MQIRENNSNIQKEKQRQYGRKVGINEQENEKFRWIITLNV